MEVRRVTERFLRGPIDRGRLYEPVIEDVPQRESTEIEAVHDAAYGGCSGEWRYRQRWMYSIHVEQPWRVTYKSPIMDRFHAISGLRFFDILLRGILDKE